MLCHEFEIAFEQADSGLPSGTLAHLEECARCRAFVADLELIRSTARSLAIPAQEPPESVWLAIRSQLAQEGLIRRPEMVAQSSWSDQLFAWLRHPIVAGAYAAIALIAVSLLWTGNPNPSTGPANAVATASLSPDISRSLDTVETAAMKQLDPNKSYADASLQRGLAVVDKFIAMCEKTVRENPRDEAAREYLYGAYQQKSELLAMAVEHGYAGE